MISIIRYAIIVSCFLGASYPRDAASPPRHLIGYGVRQYALGVAMLPLNTADLAAHKGTDPEVYRGE